MKITFTVEELTKILDRAGVYLRKMPHSRKTSSMVADLAVALNEEMMKRSEENSSNGR